ncbi:MAG: 16S rRNA (uracil(1498)-N(3))-methyltransferase [Streptosporangiaceae bacterium]
MAGPADLESDSIRLGGAEGRHASTVRRMEPGERVDLTDGAGQLAECVVTAASAGVLQLAVLARRTQARPDPALTVIQAIAKGDRGEQAVETMTEVGVDIVVPWQAERCVARWRGDRADRPLARWRATAVQAAKQSRRAWFPEVTEPAGTAVAAERVRAADLALLLDPEAPASLAGTAIPARGSIVLIVGPEGGISPAESDLLRAAGATGVRLGPTVLRASSAGAVAAGLVLGRSPRWA